MSEDKCGHRTTVQVHPSVRVGGATIGVCERECLLGMTGCEEHVSREAMAYHIRWLVKLLEQEGHYLEDPTDA